ncbi:YdaU family protein, partial [Escherichia coli]|nr:YdaU family protein [Escherichia coli]EGB7781525.1 YdaU family protein [Escherichia coli]EJD4443076.1 YdaU family protein [Escherichia coli]EJE0476895.1 YdaU family protein [Escherichia coli]
MLFVLILSHRAASYGAIMAALPYMQLYIADYLADTMHLSAEEHGAYLLLMFNYWQTGKPIPKNRLAKIARLTNERWADVEPSLQEFFCDNGEEWVHLRIEEDLASVREKLTKKSAAGKASVQARRSRKEADVQKKQERNLTGVQTDVEVVFEHDVNTKATNKDTDKDLKTDPPLNPPRGNRGVKKFDPLDIALPNWISVSLWREWVEFRQALRKPIRTEQGANGAIRELEKFRQQGFSPEQVIRHSIANEYQGLFAPKGVRPETLLRQVNTVSLP